VDQNFCIDGANINSDHQGTPESANSASIATYRKGNHPNANSNQLEIKVIFMHQFG